MANIACNLAVLDAHNWTWEDTIDNEAERKYEEEEEE